MQLLAEWGYEGLLADEDSRTSGLGLIKGDVVKLTKLGCEERIPHMGWNTVKWNVCSPPRGNSNNSDFYFVHSYAFVPNETSEIVATSDYSISITAVVNKNNIWGPISSRKSSKVD